MRTFINAVLKLIIMVLWLFSSTAYAATLSFPEAPRERSFVVDQAELLSSSDERYINQIAKSIIKDERIPIFVVTLNALEDYGAKDISVSQYAALLFDEWGIGSKERNYGMLLLVSKKDRQLRIELGHDWAGASNREAKRLVDNLIVPRFKQGEFSEGIIAGVQGMDAMGRNLSLKSPYYAWWVMPSLATLAFFCFVTAFSLIKSGKKGVGWVFMMAAIAILSFILIALKYTWETSNGTSGGSSGGGGASGSW